MDNYGTAETVKLTESWPTDVPDAGFEWIEGFRSLGPKLKPVGTYLVSRQGPTHPIAFPDDLYETFANLSRDMSAVERFASKFGNLRLVGEHFHRIGTHSALTGERWDEWKIQLERFQTAVEMWFRLQERDTIWVKRFLAPLQGTGSPWILQPPMRGDIRKPLEFGRTMVLKTINFELAGGLYAGQRCLECDFTSEINCVSQTRAVVRSKNSGPLELAIVSTDLQKTVWLQFAALVCGQRLMKKCEAKDCGQYMDVTDSARPGARRMHSRCEERIRKQNYRDRQKRKTTQ